MSFWWPVFGRVQEGPLLFGRGTTAHQPGPRWGKLTCAVVFVLFVLLQPISNADFIVPVEIDGTVHQVLYCQTTDASTFCGVMSYVL